MQINCDVGEVSREVDDAILPFVSACNVCCGAHAGDEALIVGTIQEAIRLGVLIGAHPSWPDRANFGRKTMDLPLNELHDSLVEQITFIKTIVEQEGGSLHHVKPHGALYHDVISSGKLAAELIDVVKSIDPKLAIVGMAGSSLSNWCQANGLKFVHEGFADRTYESASQLRSRSEPDAVIDDRESFLKQLQLFKSGTVQDVHGVQHELTVETICIHSDTPQAIEFAQLAHAFLEL